MAAMEQDIELRSCAIMKGQPNDMADIPALELTKDDRTERALASVAGILKLEQKEMEKMVSSELASRPPSPPESGATTPRLRIAPCPARLTSYIPPPNYGCVDRGVIFRSSYPQDRHVDFVKSLKVQSILTLVDTEPTMGYQRWVDDEKLKRMTVDIAPNKDGKVKTTVDSICAALLFVMDSTNYPLYIHCNQGKHRTGCVVACLRKIQGWSMNSIINEYENYARPKARDGDKELIRSFDPSTVFDYARSHGYFDGSQPRMQRLDSTITNIDLLAAALAAGALSDEPPSPEWDLSTLSSTSSESSERLLELSIRNSERRPKAKGERPNLAAYGIDMTLSDLPPPLSTANMLDISATDVDGDTEMRVMGNFGADDVVIVESHRGSEDHVAMLVEEEMQGRT